MDNYTVDSKTYDKVITQLEELLGHEPSNMTVYRAIKRLKEMRDGST